MDRNAADILLQSYYKNSLFFKKKVYILNFHWMGYNIYQLIFPSNHLYSKSKMIYQPYPNFIDSYFFINMFNNPLYFNYDPYLNQVKTSSNIILVNNPSLVEECCISKETSQKTHHHKRKTRKPEAEMESLQMRNKKSPKLKIEDNEVSGKKKKKITKSNKKLDMVQKQGRNSHSNILRKFFKLLTSQSEFINIVKKIITKYDLQIDACSYFEKMRERNIDHRNYIRIKEISSLFCQSENSLNIITRILFQYYLSNYYIEHLLSSKKTDSKSIIFHLKGKRTIRAEILLGSKVHDQDQLNCETGSRCVQQE